MINMQSEDDAAALLCPASTASNNEAIDIEEDEDDVVDGPRLVGCVTLSATARKYFLSDAGLHA